MSKCYVLIKLGKNAQWGYTKVDVCDYLHLMGILQTKRGRCLQRDQYGYAYLSHYPQIGTHTLLHRLIMSNFGTVDISKFEIDHVDNDKTDNRKSFLRLANRSQNQANLPKTKANTSGYKGVCWNKQAKKWQAQLKYRGHTHYLGLYDCPKQAHDAYDAASKLHHGTFANSGSE